MENEISFVETTSFNSYLNALIGLHGINLGKLISSDLILKWLFYYAIASDLLVAVYTLLSTVRLVSPDVLLAERCITLLTHSTYLQSLVKLSYLYVRRNKFQRFCDILDESFLNTPFKTNLVQIQATERRRVKLMVISLLCMVVCTAVPWCLLPVFQVLQDIHGGRYLNVPIWVPFIDIFQSPAYEIVLGVTALSSYFTTTKNIAFDGLFFSMVTQEIVQLQHLKFTMGKIFQDGIDLSEVRPTPEGVKDEEDEEHVPLTSCADAPEMSMPSITEETERTENNLTPLEITEKNEIITSLSVWVKHHQQAMRLGELLSELYSPMIMAQFVTTTLILCFTAFAITSVHFDVVQYVLTTVYCVGCSFQLFLLCHFGDRLADAGVSLSEACFASGWHKTNIKQVRSSMLIILQRVQKPLKLSFFGVYPLSAEMFVNVMQGSISYLMILLNITDDKK